MFERLLLSLFSLSTMAVLALLGPSQLDTGPLHAHASEPRLNSRCERAIPLRMPCATSCHARNMASCAELDGVPVPTSQCEDKQPMFFADGSSQQPACATHNAETRTPA